MIDPAPDPGFSADFAEIERSIARALAVPSELVEMDHVKATLSSRAFTASMREVTRGFEELREATTKAIGTFTRSALTPDYKIGDRVVWMDKGVRRSATVSGCASDFPFWLYHLRLDEPVEGPTWRRWAYSARASDLRPLNAVMLLADLS